MTEACFYLQKLWKLSTVFRYGICFTRNSVYIKIQSLFFVYTAPFTYNWYSQNDGVRLKRPLNNPNLLRPNHIDLWIFEFYEFLVIYGAKDKLFCIYCPKTLKFHKI